MHRKNKCAVRCYRAALLTLTKLPISIVLSDLYKLPCFCPKQRKGTVNTAFFIVSLPFLVGLSHLETQRNLLSIHSD